MTGVRKEAGTARLTAAETSEFKARLRSERAAMQAEYAAAVGELDNLRRSHTDGAGNDQADVGNTTFQREQQQSIAANRRDLLGQLEHALERIDAGTYGRCENCGRPIPKARLTALPMATLDAACKSREERR